MIIFGALADLNMRLLRSTAQLNNPERQSTMTTYVKRSKQKDEDLIAFTAISLSAFLNYEVSGIFRSFHHF